MSVNVQSTFTQRSNALCKQAAQNVTGTQEGVCWGRGYSQALERFSRVSGKASERSG